MNSLVSQRGPHAKVEFYQKPLRSVFEDFFGSRFKALITPRILFKIPNGFGECLVGPGGTVC